MLLRRDWQIPSAPLPMLLRRDWQIPSAPLPCCSGGIGKSLRAYGRFDSPCYKHGGPTGL